MKKVFLSVLLTILPILVSAINPNPTEVVVYALERDYTNEEREGGTGQPWDNQFFIVANRTIAAGEVTVIQFKYKAARAAMSSTWCCADPVTYLHWAALGDMNFTEEWRVFEKTFTVPAECEEKFQTITFNLAEIKDANEYYIKDVVWKIKDGTESLINQTGSDNFYVKEGAKDDIHVFVPYNGDSWTLAGDKALLGSDWDVTDNNNNMRAKDGINFTNTKTNVTLESGTYEFRVAKNHSWDVAYPVDKAALVIEETATYKINFTFNAETHHLSATATKTDGLHFNFIEKGKVAELIQNPNQYKGAVIIPSTVTHEGEEYTVTKIADNAFQGCSYLTSVTIPNSVTSIGNFAFFGCNLSTIISEIEEPFAINENVFSNKNALLIVPEGKTAAYQATEGWNKFSNIKDYDPRKRTIHVETAGTLPTLISADEKYQIEELTLTGELNGTDIHFIRDMAGVDMDRMEESELCILCNETVFTKGILRSLDLSDANIVEGGRDYYKMLWSSSSRMYGDKQYTKANTISESMFVYCRPLVELILPRSVTSISPLLFADNYGGRIYTNIKELRVAEGNPYYVSLSNGIGIIENNSNTLILGLTNNIPSSITSIGNDALNSSSFISMTIPNSVKSIGEKAFNNSLLVLTEEATTPPSITENSFPTRANIVLHVPAGSVEAYANADYWKDFKSIGAIGDIMKGDIFTAKTAEGMDLSFCVTNVSPFEAEIWSVGEYDNTQFDKSTVNIVSIPSSVIGLGDHEYNVTGIGSSAFRDCSALTSVTIPNSVTSIGGSAFYACSRLTSITIPNSVETIGSFAFSDCSGLTSVTIPNSVTSIGNYAFSGCKFSSIISEIEEPFAINENVFSNKNALLIVPEGKTASYQATEGWNKFSKIRGSDLRKRTINVEMAGTLSNYIATDERFLIEELTLTGELNIHDLLLLREMGGKDLFGNGRYFKEAFKDTDGKLSVLDMSGAKIVEGFINGYDLYWKDGVDDGFVSLSNDDDEIPPLIFYGCKRLSSITLPSSVKSIGCFAFEGTTWYDNQPDGLVYLGNVLYAYKGNMPEETNVTIKDGTLGIAFSAFFGCTGLKSLTIPKSVVSIGKGKIKESKNSVEPNNDNIINEFGLSNRWTFSDCTNLTTVISEIENPMEIEKVFSAETFANSTLFVPKGSKAAYEAANVWKDFKEIKEFAKDEEVTCALEDDNTATVMAANDPTEKDLVISESVMIGEESHPVTAIGEGAFKDNTELALVCIPETIEEIGNNAFAGCSGLTAIYSYSEEPIVLDGGKATVRTRADGGEVSASTVFALVDKNNCILYVPLNSADKYRAAEGWGEFENIVEMKSNKPGDANNDGEIDGKDVDATVGYIMEGKTDSFIFKNADVKADSKINAADIVKIVNLKK